MGTIDDVDQQVRSCSEMQPFLASLRTARHRTRSPSASSPSTTAATPRRAGSTGFRSRRIGHGQRSWWCCLLVLQILCEMEIIMFSLFVLQ
jgi:hypothetical protein